MRRVLLAVGSLFLLIGSKLLEKIIEHFLETLDAKTRIRSYLEQIESAFKKLPDGIWIGAFIVLVIWLLFELLRVFQLRKQLTPATGSRGGKGGSANVSGSGTARGGPGGSVLGTEGGSIGGDGGNAHVAGNGDAFGGEGGHVVGGEVWPPPARNGWHVDQNARGRPVDPEDAFLGRGGAVSGYGEKLELVRSILILSIGMSQNQADFAIVNPTEELIRQVNFQLSNTKEKWRARISNFQFEFFVP